MKPTPTRLRRGTLPVHGPSGVLGTAVMVGEGLALTALNVVDVVDLVGPAPGELALGVDPGRPVLAVETVPASQLALLVVPGLDGPAFHVRAEPAWVGERMLLPGYPGGYWALGQGTVSSAGLGHFKLRPPSSPGTPAVDLCGHLVGVITSGGSCAGPPRLAAFLNQLLAVTV